MPVSLLEYARRVLPAGHRPDFAAAVRAVAARPDPAPMDPFVALARRRLPADPARWRMLYIDAAILKVLAAPDDARDCIATLDHAIVIAGAGTDETRRDHVVHDLIRHLQSRLPWRAPSSAVCAAEPASIPRPPCTARNSVRSLAALPSIAAETRWSQAPFVVRGHAKHWPAMHRPHQWASLEYLYSATGPSRIVPVEVGNDYRSDAWSQELISWEEFLSSLDPSAEPRQHTTYLAQHGLLAQFPRLRKDILLPDIVYASLESPGYAPPSDVIINAWLGPKGTISPAHTDPFFNCYVQVVGRKTVWLAPPHVAPAMYPYPSSDSMSNTCRVDVFAETCHTGFPLFWEAVPDEASWVTLGPGDLLFFPPGWWHAMRSEDVSFSVSMWF